MSGKLGLVLLDISPHLKKNCSLSSGKLVFVLWKLVLVLWKNRPSSVTSDNVPQNTIALDTDGKPC